MNERTKQPINQSRTYLSYAQQIASLVYRTRQEIQEIMKKVNKTENVEHEKCSPETVKGSPVDQVPAVYVRLIMEKASFVSGGEKEGVFGR